MTLSGEGSPERERARLYDAAARIVTNAYEQGVAALQGIDEARLPERDAKLRKAALVLARDLRAAARGVEQRRAADEPPPTPARIDLGSSAATLARARTVLGEADQLLKEERK